MFQIRKSSVIALNFVSLIKICNFVSAVNLLFTTALEAKALKMAEKEVGRKPKNGPLSVMYVEVNLSNFHNVNCYSLNSGGPLFDIAIIFASNINFNVSQRRAYLHHNENVQRVLNDVDTYIRPLQARGTKVLLSILGNHHGVGVCNFKGVGDAYYFAKELKDVVEQYGLDGIDFDDEYADYGSNGTGPRNAGSFIYLLRELRYLMPNKIISFYFYGPASSRLSYKRMNAGDFLDYSWNAMYDTYDPPKVPGLAKSRLAPAAVWVDSTSADTAKSLATRTVQEGYGVYLYYDLPNHDINPYLSGISEQLYNGTGTKLTSGCLRGLRGNTTTSRMRALALEGVQKMRENNYKNHSLEHTQSKNR